MPKNVAEAEATTITREEMDRYINKHKHDYHTIIVTHGPLIERCSGRREYWLNKKGGVYILTEGIDDDNGHELLDGDTFYINHSDLRKLKL